ncbi:hypothetical protein V8C42DRAFT_325731 [Trichoderma barbatum]
MQPNFSKHRYRLLFIYFQPYSAFTSKHRIPSPTTRSIPQLQPILINMAGPVVWINAFPGTGKLTVARELVLLNQSSVLIDNHQLIDPVAARFARDHPQYQTERRCERERAFDKYVLEPALMSKTIVFTDCQTDDELGQATAQEYFQAAQKAGRPFIPIIISCDVEVNIKRATSSERTQGTTTKLTDSTLLRDILSRCRLFRFENSPYEACHIDTTDLTPGDVALRIGTYIDECFLTGKTRRC